MEAVTAGGASPWINAMRKCSQLYDIHGGKCTGTFSTILTIEFLKGYSTVVLGWVVG
jgi:hypothetical protein